MDALTESRSHTFGTTWLLGLVLAAALVGGCSADRTQDTQNPPPVSETTPPAPSEDSTTSNTPSPPTDSRLEGATHTIDEVVSSPREDSRVVLGGSIARKLTAQDFMLSDGTGEVFVDGDDDFGTLNVGDTVLVTGTVDVEDSPTRVEIQATAIERR